MCSAECQTVDFTFISSSNQFCAPATVRFSNHSPGSPIGFLWNFGNGLKSNAPNPSITFNSSGTFHVRLIVVYSKYTLEKTKDIVIKFTDHVSINSDRDQLCALSAVQFDAVTNSSATGFQWNFGDNSSLNSNSPTVSHSYTSFGTFSANVNFINANGCISKDSKIITITEPTLTGSYTIADGCTPILNEFHSTVTLNTNSQVSNYQWDFGDGNTLSNLTNDVSHSYNTAGNFEPKLTITTTDGCTQSFIFDSVRYGMPPENLIAYPEQYSFCGSEDAVFIAKADHADSYEWDFGNGSLITTADTIIRHKFTTLGLKTVTVTPKYNNCPGIPVVMQVTVIGTIAQMRYHNFCSEKNTFQFQNLSAGSNLVFHWEFGDQTTNYIQNRPIKTFPLRGEFETKLFVLDSVSGCVDSAKTKIYTARPSMRGTTSPICINSSARFLITNNYSNPNTTITWKIMGTRIGPTMDSVITYLAENLGNFSNMAIIYNGSSYCPDSVYIVRNMMVKGPAINFDVDNSLCLSRPVLLTNLSMPYLSSDTINSYSWNYGDGSNLVSEKHPLPYLYDKEGLYNISLTGTDIHGCKDSLVKQINIRPMPFVWIIPKNETYCQGSVNSIIAYTSDSLIWNTSIPVLGLCSTCDTNQISPAHTAQLFATSVNRYACTSIDSSTIIIKEPFVATTPTSEAAVCEKNSIEISAGPAGNKISWSPTTDLSNSDNYTTIVTPKETRVYKAQLTDSLGCFSSSIEVLVKLKTNPLVELGDTRFLPYKALYTIHPVYGPNVVNYEWAPADDLSCSNCAFPQTQVDKLKKYTLKVTSDSGCLTTDEITLVVECNNAYILMPSAFTPDKDGLNDIFYPHSNGIKHIKKFAIYNRNSNLLFQQSDFSPNDNSKGWNGKFRETDQPAGTYIYIIEAVCEMGQTTLKKGSFVLIR